jgi:2-polyprenyl-6-methoxyphenol hydroxylase-like FAD-dependent oxidoreductase
VTATRKPRHVEVVGAGLAGLATAAALAQRGWAVRVHEQGPELREIGAGIYLFANALRALDALGALDDVASRAEHIVHAELRDHRNHLLFDDGPSDGRLMIALRRDLHNALAKAAIDAGADIVTNSRVLAATSNGQLELESGLTEPVDLVVGTDGVYSSVRDSLGLARSIRALRDGCGRHLIRRSPADPVNRTIETWSAGRRLGVAPASPEYVYIFLCCPEADTEWRQQQPFDPRPWKRSHPWYASQIDRIPRHPDGRWLNFFEVDCHSWSAGKVALLGDSAHAMSPNLGQGACVALANAVALADHLDSNQDMQSALRRWEVAQRPVTEKAQRYSAYYGAVGTKWPHSKRLLDARSRLTKVAFIPVLTQWGAVISGAAVPLSGRNNT